MIGLNKTQTAVYLTVVRLSETSFLPPKVRDVQRQFSRRSASVPRSIKRLCERGFLGETKFGALSVLPPPHERIIADALSRSTVHRELLLGPSKDARCIHLRRSISKTLRRDHGYSFSAIGKALNRSHRSIEEYFKPDSYVVRRIIWRRNKYLSRKSAQSEMRIAA
jgi:hypothetical protein